MLLKHEQSGSMTWLSAKSEFACHINHPIADGIPSTVSFVCYLARSFRLNSFSRLKQLRKLGCGHPDLYSIHPQKWPIFSVWPGSGSLLPRGWDVWLNPMKDRKREPESDPDQGQDDATSWLRGRVTCSPPSRGHNGKCHQPAHSVNGDQWL